jgi:hypothetical protein
MSFSQEEEMVKLPDTAGSMSDSSLIIEEFEAVVRDNSKALLSWKVPWRSMNSLLLNGAVMERNLRQWRCLKQTMGQMKMDWTDEQPARGKNEYRLRCTSIDGRHRYSKSILAYVGGNLSFRFYPNPADNNLIIRSEQPVDLTIIDGNGK